jgi:hypothetical protein
VEQLYLYPQRDFTGTPKVQALVEMTNPEGERGVILGAVPYGKGWIVLDGTARETRRAWWPFGRSKGFDEDHPNAVRLGSAGTPTTGTASSGTRPSWPSTRWPPTDPSHRRLLDCGRP